MKFERHTTEEHTQTLADFLPNGHLYLAKNDPTKNMRKLLIGLAAEMRRVEDNIALLSEEHDIRQTTLLIEEWERAMGIPDDCFGIADTLEQRRANVITKLQASGISTEAGFIALANTLGFPNVEISCGFEHHIFPLPFPIIFFETTRDARFTMIVKITGFDACDIFPLEFPIPFKDCSTAIIECLFNKLVPANVKVRLIFEN